MFVSQSPGPGGNKMEQRESLFHRNIPRIASKKPVAQEPPRGGSENWPGGPDQGVHDEETKNNQVWGRRRRRLKKAGRGGEVMKDRGRKGARPKRLREVREGGGAGLAKRR